MQLEFKNTIKIEEYMKLREAVGFNKRNIEQSEAGFKNANKVIGCYDGEKAIGCARILWDGGCTAYLSDVLVEPEYQHRGIGSKMINKQFVFWRVK